MNLSEVNVYDYYHDKEMEDGLYLVLSCGDWMLLDYEDSSFYYANMPIKKYADIDIDRILGPIHE